jgi:hypothetical protein
MSTIKFEVTDTFGGEANYSWVNRESHKAEKYPSRLALVRALKKFAGLTHQRCSVSDFGDMVEVRPVGRSAPCIVAFAEYCHD